MSKRVLWMSLILAALSASWAHAQSKPYSYLGNINCGGGQATCYKSLGGRSGQVGCTCRATCLPDRCPQKTVYASKIEVWGASVPGSLACTIPLSVTATGGTMVPPNPTYFAVSAVWAQINVVELGINVGTSREIDDCYQGIVEDDPDFYSVLC